MKPQLFLLHFAGGSCYSLQFLLPYLNQFNTILLELPGRGRRLEESLLTDFQDAAADLADKIKMHVDGSPFLIYGHSMGATLALKIAAIMEAENKPPARLIVSGNAGPGTSTAMHRHTLPSEDFKNELRRLGGMPEEVLSDEDLFSFFEPIIRADFEIAHNNDLISLPPVKSDIYAVMGTEEEAAGRIDNWGKFTSGKFSKEILSGGHFFINHHAKRIADIICENYS